MKRAALLLLLAVQFLTPLVLADDNVNVSAVVPAHASDFTIALSTTDLQNPVGQSHTIPIQIDYTNDLSYPTTVTVQASWTRGTVQGDSSPSVSLLDYVPGSATQGYNNTTPVVDTSNRTITWTITSYPGNSTSDSVNFSLITSDSYFSDLPVAFSVSSTLAGPGVTLPSTDINRQFQMSPPTTAPTPTSSPNTSPSNPSPTITPTPESISIQNITTQSIQSTQADVSVLLSQPGHVTGLIGTSPNNLKQAAVSSNNIRFHTLSFTGLKPATKYYFRVSATGAGGKTVLSDLYTVTTSDSDIDSLFSISSFVVTSNNVILSSTGDSISSNSAIIPVVLLPTQALYEFRFSIPGSANISNLQAFLRNHNVLGVATDTTYQTELIDLIETSPGIYLGRLRAPKNPGIYDLYLHLSDMRGNIVERKVSIIGVSKPIGVFAKKSASPVEGAQVTFYILNTKTKKYDRIKSSSISLANPSYTDSNGQIPVALPRGKYKIVVDTLNFAQKEVLFSVGEDISNNYPQIYLDPSGINIMHTVGYFITGFTNVFWSNTMVYLQALTTSNRMAHLIIAFLLLALLFITLLSLSKRMQLPLGHLPRYLFAHILKKHGGTSTVTGKITNHTTENGIAHVAIYLTDPDSHSIVAHGITNAVGVFRVSCPEGNYRISCLKEGYQSVTIFENLPLQKDLHLNLLENDKGTTLGAQLLNFLSFVLEAFFEVLLFGSFILIALITTRTGWMDMLPLLLLSATTIYVWYIHHKERETIFGREA